MTSLTFLPYTREPGVSSEQEKVTHDTKAVHTVLRHDNKLSDNGIISPTRQANEYALAMSTDYDRVKPYSTQTGRGHRH